MTTKQAFIIDDRRGASKMPAAIGTFIAFFIVTLVVHIAFVEGLLGAIALAAFVHGVSVLAPVPGDNTVKFKVRARTSWLSWGCAAVLAVACFLALNEEGHGWMMPLIFLGIPAVALGLYGARQAGMLNGGSMNRGK